MKAIEIEKNQIKIATRVAMNEKIINENGEITVFINDQYGQITLTTNRKEWLKAIRPSIWASSQITPNGGESFWGEKAFIAFIDNLPIYE